MDNRSTAISAVEVADDRAEITAAASCAAWIIAPTFSRACRTWSS